MATSPAPLIGIARLAHAAPELQRKNFATYLQLPSFRMLNRVDSERLPFQWTINPYRGCEIGCVYCYARYTHEFMELREASDFETRIFAKQWNPDVFRSELRRIDPSEAIAIGTATDPYQPAERKFRLTRAILETIASGFRGRRIGITTKSDLVTRDMDLLVEIGRHNDVTVNLTITTTDAALARKLEPRAPRPDLRLRAMAELAAAGVAVGVSCAPVLPLINDRVPQLDTLAGAARAAGAQWFWGNVLFLPPAARTVFFAFLGREFPHLAAKYKQHFSAGAYLRGVYPERLSARLKEVRARHGFGEPGDGRRRWLERSAREADQLRLEF